jgi:hypothetical protein
MSECKLAENFTKSKHRILQINNYVSKIVMSYSQLNQLNTYNRKYYRTVRRTVRRTVLPCEHFLSDFLSGPTLCPRNPTCWISRTQSRTGRRTGHHFYV